MSLSVMTCVAIEREDNRIPFPLITVINVPSAFQNRALQLRFIVRTR